MISYIYRIQYSRGFLQQFHPFQQSMQTDESLRKNTLPTTILPHHLTFALPHSQSEKLLHSSSLQKSFRKRSVKPRNIPFIEEPTFITRESSLPPPQALGQLKFLTELLQKKHSALKAPEEQPPSKRISKDYQYYDMIVRDLISEIRERSTKEISPSPQPIQKSVRKAKTFKVSSPQKPSESPRKTDSQYGSIKVVNREKMVFSLTLAGSDTVYQRKITSYVQFLYKLNFANKMYVDLSLSRPKTLYRVKVGPGNNSMLLRSLIRRRFWLELTSSNDCHFEWTQQTSQQTHDSQLAHSSEERLRGKPGGKGKPLPNSSDELLGKILYRQEIELANQWYERSDCGKISCFQLVQVHRVTNHLPLNCIIGAKRILFRLLHWYYSHILCTDPFQVLPKTYSFDPPSAPASIKAFLQAHSTFRKVWIVKPGQNTNRGNGIRIVQTSELVSLLCRQRNRGSEMRPLIVQEYIRPFLYQGRKFDIRHYLLVTSHNGIIRGYWYRQGYIRTSSEKYDIEDMDEMIHLTNDAVQKRGDKYGKYETANKLSYSQFQRYLDAAHPHKHYNFHTQILEKMKEITSHMLRAAFQFMDPQRKQHNFELYGLDFYISSKFKPYLIECNANPCLEINCPILERIIPGAVEHALRIALDPLFPPPQHYPPAARYHLCDKVLEKIKYELIFDEKLEGQALRQQTALCGTQLDLTGVKLRPEQDEFEDEGEELGQETPVD